MRITFPETGASITGEAGDNIGRGGRKAIYFVDESAHIPNPKALDASLSANTDCRQDMSSVFGMNNSFAERAHNSNIERFNFHWKDDPRKDDEWEKRKRNELDPVIFEAEYNCNFMASVEGVVIPSAWVIAAVDVHKRFGLMPQGKKKAALDVADTGQDKNAMGLAQQFLISYVESWKGTADLDIYHTAERSFLLCDQNGVDGYLYDADGLGAGIRGDARKINEARVAAGSKRLSVQPFRGSGEVHNPEEIVPGTERTAGDFFENAKAQGWWTLRQRFQYTYRFVERLNSGEDAIALAMEIDVSKFISIAGDFAERAKFCMELSQPVWGLSKNGKMMVDKCPVGTKTEVRKSISSPNLADTAMMLYAPRAEVIVIHPGVLAATAAIHHTAAGARR